MDGATGDSDHSMTWEDFFGSTTDLTPTLIGIYDSLLEPEKSLRPESCRLETAKDARNDPPVIPEKEPKDINISKVQEAPTKMTGGVKLPISNYNKSSLYAIRTKSDKESVSDEVNKCNVNDAPVNKVQRTFKETKQVSDSAFDNLSPNVKRMLSSSEMTTLKFQKKAANVGRTSMRRSNIPLVGATSKISQSGVEILPSVEIYDQPCVPKNLNKSKSENSESLKPALKPEFKIDDAQTYDVPTNNRPAIYDVPVNNKTAFESLSLPYIDQSIELSITSNDREFDIKLSSKDVSPLKQSPPIESPATIPIVAEGTNSLHRKDFLNKTNSPPKLLSKSIPYPEAVSSTGNLKCEKEVIRLNPPVLEVSRPLSMSSIASSSSTSSSGVQNKGVNSAYLASIESLDDHSDADMTSANGSNSFMNKAGIMTESVSEERNSVDTTPQLVDELPGLSQLERVCAEIIQTENVYVEDLRQVVEGYLHVWRKQATFSDEQLSELFNNIEHIYAFNRSLCAELNTCRLDATSIARCFVNNTTGFSVYTSYCTGYPRTMERLAALASDPLSAREFRERQIELGHLLPLASYLLKPVQRILKYHLLLQNVVKQCASRETEYALLKMTGIAQHIDDMKRRHEHAVRVQEIQSLLYGWNGPDLTTYGELCAEGTFRVFGAKAMRHAFLFDKMLLVTKNREDGILAYKTHIMCNNMMLVEAIAGAPLSFHVIPWDAPRAQLTLQARSQRHKREWTLLLKRVILENYNAVIPSHARQLVMELGQNKTDDDMLAEKSHNLITQASMRKQLSAPEYLEKRKLDRDRRKSFESGIRGRLKKVNRKYTVPSSRAESQECDCSQVSTEKGIDYTCENCYVDLCSDCETEVGKNKRDDKCSCRHDGDLTDKCPECDRSLHYIDSGSAERLGRKQSSCKCTDFKSSQESFGKDFGCSLNKTRGYHSSDNIIGYTDNNKSKEDLSDNNTLSSVRKINKTCLKCEKIKENIAVTDSTSTLRSRRSRCSDIEKTSLNSFRSKSKDDPQRSKLSKIGTWRRKSEPGLQQNMIGIIAKKAQENDSEKSEIRGNEKIEFECRNCGSNKLSKKTRTPDGTIISDSELDISKRIGLVKPAVEIRMYNTKNIPKKISKIKKNRAKGLRLGSDTTAKFYTDFSTDVSTENILHISESNDSLNIDKPKDNHNPVPETISKDEDIDEETYKRLIEKTDSFKKNELEKVKYLNKQKVINEASEIEDKVNETEIKQVDVAESCEDTEQPLEQIISQLLMQNREFQKLVKKQQLRNSAQRRHQRLMKSHSTPEQNVLAKNLETNKLKAKYGKQISEDLDVDKNEIEEDNTTTSSRTDLNDESIEDHIYETLRIENRVDENLDAKNIVMQHTNNSNKLPSPPNVTSIETEVNKYGGPDSDYVYLSFDKLNKLRDAEGIYDVPVRSPEKVAKKILLDDYVTMEQKRPPIDDAINENVYDSLVEVCRRKKDGSSELSNDYLPMSPDQSPNTPEIWLSRQKEHFNVSRDRKSGSLPRSFQVITNNPDENLSTFKCKPNSTNKTYLNREGKVMSTDRPYTIASDQSEIIYDDMNEGDILKFNKSKTNEVDYVENISQSTLELEEEIDRCYKNNFAEMSFDNNKNENITVSQPNLNVSTTSSCEVLALDKTGDTKTTNIEVIHPEHKIYKPTSNMLSLKNVLNRFKNRTPNKTHSDESEINANDQSSPDSTKSDIKSPEKRSALNPRSYSKNLLQRFRNIIGDEHTDDNQNKSETLNKVQDSEDIHNSIVKSDIKVVVTSTDTTPIVSTLVNSVNNDLLSKSVCENTTMTESQTEKNNLEEISLSCDNINQKSEIRRPKYDKSISVGNNVSNSTGSPTKSNNSSYQSLYKLPIYMQGSKHLGARIAQSDYVDPTTLVYDKSTTLKKVNVLINKNSVRPDSLFSNSSFVTSSSEGVYQEPVNKLNTTTKTKISTEYNLQSNADESYYEKSFEKIEQVTDEDVFRDSAVYSDQEDSEDTKDTAVKNEAIHTNNKVTRVESIKRKTTLKSQQSVNEHVTTQTRVIVTSNKTANVESVNSAKKSSNIRPKVAPPVPAKPKITRIPSVSNPPNKGVIKTLSKSSEQSSSSESVNLKTIKRNSNYKQQQSLDSTINEMRKVYDNNIKSEKSETKIVQDVKIETLETKTVQEDVTDGKLNPQGNIQMKRLSFERASLDSATRKMKPNVVEPKSILDKPKSTKSVLERRMEIEQMSKTQVKLNSKVKKPVQPTKPKSITTKVATFERSVSDIGVKEHAPSTSTESNIPNRNSTEQKPENECEKASWVKQVVNKFQ